MTTNSEGMARHLAYLAQHPEIAVGAYVAAVHPTRIVVQGNDADMVESRRLLAEHPVVEREEWTDHREHGYLERTYRIDGVTIEHVSEHPHVYEVDDDTIRCSVCSRLRPSDPMPPEVVERVSAAIQAEVDKR